MVLFNVNQVSPAMEAANNFELIAEGYHNFIVENAEVRDSKKGTGSYIELTCKLEGSNRKQWHYFNIQHSNPQVADRGLVDLKKFCLAANIQQIDDVSVLCDLIFCAKIVHMKDQQGRVQAKMVEFRPYSENNLQSASSQDVPF